MEVDGSPLEAPLRSSLSYRVSFIVLVVARWAGRQELL